MSEMIVNARYFTDPETGRPVRVTTHLDSAAGINPRKDYDHFADLLTYDRRYESPDSMLSTDVLNGALERWAHHESVEVARVARYAAMFHPGEVLFVGGLGRNGYDGQLWLISDPAWRSSYDGIILVTRENWVKAMGEGYTGSVTPQQLARDELAEYNAWASGEIYGYRVVKASDDSDDIEDGTETDACWGMIDGRGDDYVMAEGVMAVLGRLTVNEADGWQHGYELTRAEFEQALTDWTKQHGHRPTGTGWPR